MTQLLDDLRARGLVHDSTDPDALAARLDVGPIGIYVGFDPTATSLHIGNLYGQLTLRRFQLAGHRPVALAGGATGMVGDPSGRSDERNLLDAETLAANVAAIEGQLAKILDFEPGPYRARLVNNATWTAPMSFLDFLRDVGKHVTVNQMLAKESVRNRIASENGISYTEFSYMLLQANDFRHLYEHEGVEMQAGGSDQWGNITQGIDLIRRTSGSSAFGLTWPLLLKSDGTKFGKSAGGSVWLDPEQTSPYQFRQFWIGTEDADVERLLLQFTLLPVTEIAEIVRAHHDDPGRREAQRVLAREVTSMVHSADAYRAADEAAAVLFGGADPASLSAEALGAVAREVGVVEVDGDDLVGALVASGLASSNGDARRGLEQRGFSVNGRKLEPNDALWSSSRLQGRWLLLAKGRKNFRILSIRS